MAIYQGNDATPLYHLSEKESIIITDISHEILKRFPIY